MNLVEDRQNLTYNYPGSDAQNTLAGTLFHDAFVFSAPELVHHIRTDIVSPKPRRNLQAVNKSAASIGGLSCDIHVAAARAPVTVRTALLQHGFGRCALKSS